MEEVREQLPGALGFNGPFFVRLMVGLIYREMARLGVITLGAIVVLLLVAVRRFSLLTAMLVPLLVNGLWTFGCLGWLGIRLNMMNAVVAVFVFGLIVDYSIFLSLALQRS